MARNCEILVPNSRFSIKPVAIRPEMLSNSLIHFPNRTQRTLSILPLCFYTKHPHIPGVSKTCVQKPFKNTSNFVKPCTIRPQMLSNSLIHSSSRTRRALSIPLLCFSTKHPHLPKISKSCEKVLVKYIKVCKTCCDSRTNAHQLSHSLTH